MIKRNLVLVNLKIRKGRQKEEQNKELGSHKYLEASLQRYVIAASRLLLVSRFSLALRFLLASRFFQCFAFTLSDPVLASPSIGQHKQWSNKVLDMLKVTKEIFYGVESGRPGSNKIFFGSCTYILLSDSEPKRPQMYRIDKIAFLRLFIGRASSIEAHVARNDSTGVQN